MNRGTMLCSGHNGSYFGFVEVNDKNEWKALGMSRMSIWSRIKVPMALRNIIPPVGNQWIFMMKATTIGIGFSDLFYITVNSIKQRPALIRS